MQFSDYVTSVRMSILCILCNTSVTFNFASPKTDQTNITRMYLEIFVFVIS